MVDLKEACRIALSESPDDYIHVVNEYEDAYEFILLKKGSSIGDYSFVIPSTVDKRTGEFRRDDGWSHDGSYKQYTREELERF